MTVTNCLVMLAIGIHFGVDEKGNVTPQLSEYYDAKAKGVGWDDRCRCRSCKSRRKGPDGSDAYLGRQIYFCLKKTDESCP